jgi:hypothetical protein
LYCEINVAIETKAMKVIQPLFKSALIAASVAGFGILGGSLSAMAMSTMPTGYTLSKTPLKGQHCYRHNNEANLYCYRNKIDGSMMKNDSSMMKKEGSSMMKKDDSMMKNDSMMKKDDSMMKNDSMMKK